MPVLQPWDAACIFKATSTPIASLSVVFHHLGSADRWVGPPTPFFHICVFKKCLADARVIFILQVFFLELRGWVFFFYSVREKWSNWNEGSFLVILLAAPVTRSTCFLRQALYPPDSQHQIPQPSSWQQLKNPASPVLYLLPLREIPDLSLVPTVLQ